jgi:hypothetical protein
MTATVLDGGSIRLPLPGSDHVILSQFSHGTLPVSYFLQLTMTNTYLFLAFH